MRPTGGRKVNVSNSRREEPPKRGRAPREPKEPREKAKHPILRALGRTLATLICLGIMVCSLAAVAAVYYAVQATANDGNLLDLDNIQLSQSSVVMANDPDTGAQVEYATLRSSNSHRVWADLEQIPTNLQYAFICTEDKDFYNEPGVNFKRTIGAMVNEYLLPIYSSKQGASTLEQQLIKNLTGDNEQDNMRKVREIFRALGLDNKYSKETILEAYLNTIPLTGIIHGMEAGSIEYFGKHVEDLTLAECATLASITKNPTKYNPATNPEELIKRRNHVLYEMYTQGYITEAEFNAAKAETVTLTEKTSTTENATRSSSNSWFTDALYTQLLNQLQEDLNYTADEAKELIFSGKVIGAAEAEKIGLVNAVYAPEELIPGAIAMAKSFTANAPIAVKYSKACIDRGMQMDIDDGIALENELFAMCFATADQKEGMSAFVEKRKEKHFQNK